MVAFDPSRASFITVAGVAAPSGAKWFRLIGQAGARSLALTFDQAASDTATKAASHQRATTIAQVEAQIGKAAEDLELSGEDAELFEKASGDAKQFLASVGTSSTPYIEVSDEGIVSVQWHGVPHGLLLMFLGAGRASYAIGGRDKGYAVGIKRFDLGGELPDDLRSMLRRF